MKKPNTLDEAIAYIKNIPNVNFGGCGIAALALYRFLRVRGEYSQIVFFNQQHASQSALDNIRYDLEETEDASAVSHVGLYYNEKFIDCSRTGVILLKYKYFEFVDELKLVNALNNGYWNDTFDRELYTPRIAKRLNVKLNDIKLASFE